MRDCHVSESLRQDGSWREKRGGHCGWGAGTGRGMASGQWHDGELGGLWAPEVERGAGRSLKAGHWVLNLM